MMALKLPLGEWQWEFDLSCSKGAFESCLLVLGEIRRETRRESETQKKISNNEN